MGGTALNGRRAGYEEAGQLAAVVAKQIKEQEGNLLVQVAGSLRRVKPEVGDIDLVVALPPLTVQTQERRRLFDWMRQTCGEQKPKGRKGEPVKWHGLVLPPGTCLPKTSFLFEGVQVDLNLVPEESYGAAMLHCTGSVTFNMRCRNAALRRGWMLNQYGLWKKVPEGQAAEVVSQGSEKEILDLLGIGMVMPTQRG